MTHPSLVVNSNASLVTLGHTCCGELPQPISFDCAERQLNVVSLLTQICHVMFLSH
jgi:hypothetical protein